MFPRLYTFDFGAFQIPIHSFGLMFMSGFLGSVWICIRRGKPLGYDPDRLMDLGITLMLGAIVGARINYILVEPRQFKDSVRLFDLGDGGLNLVGALAFGLLPLFLRWRRGRRTTTSESRSVGASERDGAARPVDPQTLQRSDAPTLGPSDAPTTASPLGGLLSLWVLTLLSALAGARLVHVLFHRGDYDYEVFKVWNGGIVFYGGFIGATTAGVWFGRRERWPILRTMDMILPAIFIGLMFGRIGCFLNGCCFGAACAPAAVDRPSPIAPRPTAEPSQGLCVRFPAESPAWYRQIDQGKIPRDAKESLPVLPTQLFESAAALAIFGILSWLWRRKTFDGQTVCQAALLYGPWRFFNENLRDDTDPFRLAGISLTYSQWVSVAFVALALAAWPFLKSRRPESSKFQVPGSK